MLRRLTDPLGKYLTQDDELGLGPNSLYYDLTGGIQVPTTNFIFRLEYFSA